MHEYQVGPDRVAAAKIGSGCVNTTATLATVMALNAIDRAISPFESGFQSGSVTTHPRQHPPSGYQSLMRPHQRLGRTLRTSPINPLDLPDRKP